MQASNPGGGSVAIHCDGFHALIIDSFVPQHWKSFEFLQMFDAIIALQWTTKTNALLVDLLSSLTTEHLNTKRSTTPLHLKCLIIPRPLIQPSRCCPGIANSPKKQSNQPSCLTIALHLGISVMQLGPARASNSRYLQCVSHKEYSWTDKEARGNLTYANLSRLDASTTRLKETVLFHKFGIGTLSMIPIFLRQEDSAHSIASFNALLVWLPAKRLACDRIGCRSLPARYFLVCCSYNSAVETKTSLQPTTNSRPNSCTNGACRTTKNETIDRHAVKQLRYFISQLTTKLVQPSFSPIWRSKLGASSKQLRTGLSESITFASGVKWFNTLQNEDNGSKQTDAHGGYRETKTTERLMDTHGGICFEPRDNSHDIQVGTKLTVNRELLKNVSDVPYSEVYSKNMSVEPFPANCYKPGIPISNSNEIKKDTTLAPNPAVNRQSSTVNGLNGNKTHGSSKNLADNIHPQFTCNSDTISHIPKSFSCPNSFASDEFNPDAMVSTSPQRPESIWSDMRSSVFSATVLLSIPEVGEADFYADSPQCLTVADLRAMGLYDDSDESDEDAGDEDEMLHDHASQDVLELTPLDRLR